MARLKRVTSVFDQTELSEEFIFLGSIADLVETEMQKGEWEVVLNGRVLGRDEWEVTYPTDSCCVMIHPIVAGGGQGNDDKSAMRMALLIGVSVASMGVGGALGGQAAATMFGVGFNSAAQTGIVIAGMTATNIVGGMLVNKFLPPPETENRGKGLSIYNWNTTATQEQGLPIPMWYGHFKFQGGNVVDSFREFKYDQESINQGTPTLNAHLEAIIAYGLGPWNNILQCYLKSSSGQKLSAGKGFKLGYLASPKQAEFGETNLYTSESVLLDLPFLTNNTTVGNNHVESGNITITTTNANLTSVKFTVAFPAGCYAYNPKTFEYKPLVFNFSLGVIPHSLAASQYESPLVVRGIPTILNDIANTGITGTRIEVVNQWSYGYFCDLTTPATWISFGVSSNGIADMPTAPPSIATTTLLSKDHYWRYISSEQVIDTWDATPGYFRTITGTSQLYNKDYLLLEFEAELIPINDTLDLILNARAWQSAFTDVDVIAASTILSCEERLYSSTVKPQLYPRNVLAYIKAPASQEFTDPIPFIEFEGRKVAVFNGTTWSFEYSNNPAWVCYDILSQPLMPDEPPATWTTTSPALRYEGMEPSKLDYVSFKAWADFCDTLVTIPEGGTEKRYTFNGGFDEVNNLWEAALAVAGMSQAWLVWEGSQVTVTLDHTTSVTQLFTTGNYLLDSVKETYIPMSDRATLIEVDYIDAANDWQRNKFSVSESGYSDVQKKVGLQLRGCTSATQAYRSGKFELLKNKHLKKTVEFQAPLNAITCVVGDVVEFQSSVNKNNLGGGRIKGIVPSGNIVYGFDGSTDGWVATVGSTLVAGTSSIVLTGLGTTTDQRITKSGLSFSGVSNRYITIRLRRLTGSAWDGILYYSTAGHGYSGSYRKDISQPTWDGEYKIITFDMHNLTFGGTDYALSTITGLRFDPFGNAGTDSFEIDYITIGNSISNTILELDNSYIFDGAKTYNIKGIKENGTLITAVLTSISGTTSVVELTSQVTLHEMDSYAIGEIGFEVEKLRVLDISQTTDLLCTLSCVQYFAELYDYNDSDMPRITYTPVADMPVVVINNISTYSYFDDFKIHKSRIVINITKPTSVYYKQAKVYFRETASTDVGWVFAGIMQEDTFSFEVSTIGVEYTVVVATVNTQDITMNILDAPSNTVTTIQAVLAAASSLIATPQYLATLASWVHPNNKSVSGYELWMASSNNRAVAAKVYSGIENNTLVQIRHDLNYYLWVRAVDSLGGYGTWFPTSSTAGILATSAALQLDQIDEYNQTAPNPTFVSQPTFS